MFPMISGVEEFRRAKEVLGSVAEELAREGIVPTERIRLGAMIEIPSAAAVADELAAEADFFSVGTNERVTPDRPPPKEKTPIQNSTPPSLNSEGGGASSSCAGSAMIRLSCYGAV